MVHDQRSALAAYIASLLAAGRQQEAVADRRRGPEAERGCGEIVGATVLELPLSRRIRVHLRIPGSRIL